MCGHTVCRDCGVANELTDRVVGGAPALQGQFPWQVGLVREQDPSRQFCGGSLISSRHVLTAAHCTDGLSPTSIGVTVGLTDLASSDDQTGAVVTVKEIINHPEYRSGLDLEEFKYNLQYLKRVRNKIC